MAYDHGAFRVRNRDEAIRFYTEKLGFRLLHTTDAPEIGELGAFLEYDGARLELIEKLGVTYEPVKPEHPYCPHLCFETDDLDAVMRMLAENGIEILAGPNEIPGSERWLYFTDPDYNVLEFIHWMDKSKAQ